MSTRIGTPITPRVKLNLTELDPAKKRKVADIWAELQAKEKRELSSNFQKVKIEKESGIFPAENPLVATHINRTKREQWVPTTLPKICDFPSFHPANTRVSSIATIPKNDAILILEQSKKNTP